MRHVNLKQFLSSNVDATPVFGVIKKNPSDLSWIHSNYRLGADVINISELLNDDHSADNISIT